jgi:GDP-L-fucose synthase
MQSDDIILVCGHTGQVGSILCAKLRNEGYVNVIGASKSTGNDFTDQQDTKKFFLDQLQPDYVFLCSAVVGGIEYNRNNQYKLLYENLMIQNNIIDCCRNSDVKKVVFLGSSCVYPKDYKQPLKERYILNAPPEETNFGYAIAKIAGLSLCELANKEAEDPYIVSLMPCNLYSSNDTFDLEKSHVMSALVKKICDAKINNDTIVEVWGSGKAKREFLHAVDLVDCMIWAIDNLEIEHSFYNVGAGEDISIEELALTIAEIAEYKGGFWFNTEKPDGMMRKLMDSSKLYDKGWKPKISLKQGIENMVEHYMLEGEC